MISNDFSLNSASRQEKERLAAYLWELKEAHDKSRLLKFKPNPGFQTNFVKSLKKIRLCFTGNQEGKTTISAYEAACYALGQHPIKKIRVPNVGWIVTAKPLKEGVEKEILPKLKEVTGTEDILDIKNNSQGIPYKIFWRTGSVTFLLSAEQEDKVFEGSTIDWAWFDEPMRRDIYIAVRRGLMKAGGHLWWSMTPLSDPWIYDELYQKAMNGDPEIDIFQGEPGENIHVSKEERDSFKSTLTPEEIETRIYGKFRHLSGRVIKAYKPEIHRIPSFDIPGHWPVWASIDPHRHKPHAVVFWASAPTGVHYICNEIYLACTLNDLRELTREISDQYRMVEFLIDTSAQEKDPGRLTIREILAQDGGIRTKLAQKNNKKHTGILMLNQLFSENKLFVMEHCKRTHRELMLNVYRKNKSDSGQILEEPEKKFDDCLDAMRYIVVERPSFSGTAQIKQNPVPYQRL